MQTWDLHSALLKTSAHQSVPDAAVLPRSSRHPGPTGYFIRI